MFSHVLQISFPAKTVYVCFSSAAGWTRYILMFYSLEYVFHWHGYHDKASLTVLKGVSKDFCQGLPLWRRVSGCHSTIVQWCALVRVPFFKLREDGSILHDTLEKSRGRIFGAYLDAWRGLWTMGSTLTKPCFKAHFRGMALA